MYLNKVFLIGNLTRDPELKALPTGAKVAAIGLATNRTWKDQSGAKKEATNLAQQAQQSLADSGLVQTQALQALADWVLQREH